MPQSFASLHLHIVFSTKHREPRLDPAWRPRLFQYMGGVLRQSDSVLVAAGGVEDHVHLLALLGRSLCVADAVKLLKTSSNHWLQETFDHLRGFHWQTGYGAFAVSFSSLDAVKKYLADQEQHHRRQSFQEEYREILRRHGIEWDERYVWD